MRSDVSRGVPPAFATPLSLPAGTGQHVRLPPCSPTFRSRAVRRPVANFTVRTAMSAGPSAKPETLKSTVAARAAAAFAAGLLALAPSPHLDNLVLPHWPDLHLGNAAQAAKGGGDTFLSASGKVIKDGESLLRWSLPISNKPVRELQSSLESAITNTRGLKWGKIDGDLRRAKAVLNNKEDLVLKDVSAGQKDEAQALLKSINERMSVLFNAAAEKSVEKLVQADKDILRDVGKVEELMVSSFPYEVPAEYANLPQLKGRATVDVVVRKLGNEQFDIDGTLYDEGAMTLVLDGYSAPLSAGSFVDLAAKGFYNNREIIRSDGFIVQSGKPDKGEGYETPDGKVRIVPLEIFAKGDKAPSYGYTLEEDGRGAAATVLPFSSFGTLAMAREEFEPNTASSQFFWFLFEPDLTPAGRNLMDGSWSVFGYTVKGEKFLRGLQRGDQIVSAKVTSGLENLRTVAESSTSGDAGDDATVDAST